MSDEERTRQYMRDAIFTRGPWELGQPLDCLTETGSPKSACGRERQRRHSLTQPWIMPMVPQSTLLARTINKGSPTRDWIHMAMTFIGLRLCALATASLPAPVMSSAMMRSQPLAGANAK